MMLLLRLLLLPTSWVMSMMSWLQASSDSLSCCGRIYTCGCCCHASEHVAVVVVVVRVEFCNFLISSCVFVKALPTSRAVARNPTAATDHPALSVLLLQRCNNNNNNNNNLETASVLS